MTPARTLSQALWEKYVRVVRVCVRTSGPWQLLVRPANRGVGLPVGHGGRAWPCPLPVLVSPPPHLRHLQRPPPSSELWGSSERERQLDL